MNDSKMPERIEFCYDPGGDYLGSVWREGAVVGAVPYIRADLAHPAPVAYAELDEDDILDAIESVHDMDVTLRDYARAVHVAIRARTARPVGEQWHPIETAPKGASTGGRLPVSLMMLAVPDGEGGFHTVSGIRIGDRFYAALTFYCGGPFDGKQLELREMEVSPTHWMPLPDAPALLTEGGA